MPDLLTLGLIALGLAVLLWGPFAAWIAAQKGRSAGEGFALGLLFGPLGILVEALLPNQARQPRERPGPTPRPGQDSPVPYVLALLVGVVILVGGLAVIVLTAP